MSDLLSLQNVMIARCEYYTDVGETRKRPVITQEIQGDIAHKSVLLLDDVADSGESLIVLKKYVLRKKPAKLSIATLYVKPWAKFMPDYFVAKTSAWIVFPWELLEAMKSVNAKDGFASLKGIGIPENYFRRLVLLDESLKR